MVAISVLGLLQLVFNMRENRYWIVASGSMEPTYNVGDVLKTKLGVDACDIYAASKDANPPGDIIVFERPGDPGHELVVHRAIIKVIEDGACSFKTQGDANWVPDGWTVKESDLVGKVVESNPPFWTYNSIFWLFILGMGTVFLTVGIVFRQRELAKVETIQEKRPRGQILSSEDNELLSENTLSTEEKKVSKVCPDCGRVLEETWKGCPYCGKDLTGSQKPRGRTYGMLSIILGVISLIVFGIPLGLAAIICGLYAVAREDMLGIVGVILGVVGAALAMLLLVLLF